MENHNFGLITWKSWIKQLNWIPTVRQSIRSQLCIMHLRVIYIQSWTTEMIICCLQTLTLDNASQVWFLDESKTACYNWKGKACYALRRAVLKTLQQTDNSKRNMAPQHESYDTKRCYFKCTFCSSGIKRLSCLFSYCIKDLSIFISKSAAVGHCVMSLQVYVLGKPNL